MPFKPTIAFATFNGAAAQAFIYERSSKRLAPLAGFPMSGPKKPEFSYPPGRMFNSADNRRSAAEPPSDHEKLIERDFVSDVAQRLDKLRARKAFDRLIVAAGPTALGFWRDVAPAPLSAVVDKELDSDYATMDQQALLPLVEKAFRG
jgi:hypothetical protein